MNLKQALYFATVAEELHFGRAAQRLSMSQPPLSQQIKALEEELDVMLFHRTKREVRLTKAGAGILPEAYRLLEQADRLKKVARRVRTGEYCQVFIGCVSSACFDLLPTILHRFDIDCPGLTVSVKEYDTADALPAIVDGRLDFGLVRIDKVEAPLSHIPLRQDHFVVALPNDHVLARKKRVALADLGGENFTMFSRLASPRFYDSIIAAFLKAGFSPSITHETNSIQTQTAFVACHLGVALVPSITKKLMMPGVVYRDLNETIPLTDISLVWNEARQSELHRRIIDSVQRAAGASDLKSEKFS
jgi:DNA-binding transcriptional LysR family regulator